MFNACPSFVFLVIVGCLCSGRIAFAQRSAMPGSPSWSSDGQKIAFDASVSDSTDQKAIYVINADGTGLTRLSGPGDDDSDPAWSPNGTKIAFSSQGDIWVMNPDGSGRTRLTTALSKELAPVWSPDGTKIACLTDRNEDTISIIIINAITGKEIQYVSASSEYLSGRPSWSPDGNKLVFQRGSHLYLRDLTTFTLTQLTTGAENEIDCDPVWSPDGIRILFNTVRLAGRKLYFINADRSGLRRVTTEQDPDDETWINEILPAWSRDGTKIVYVREYNYKDPEDPDHREDQQLYIVNTDGTGRRQLTSLYLVKADKPSKGFLVQNKKRLNEQSHHRPKSRRNLQKWRKRLHLALCLKRLPLCERRSIELVKRREAWRSSCS